MVKNNFANIFTTILNISDIYVEEVDILCNNPVKKVCKSVCKISSVQLRQS